MYVRVCAYIVCAYIVFIIHVLVCTVNIYSYSPFFGTQIATSFCNLLFPLQLLWMVLSQYLLFLMAFDLSKMINEEYYLIIVLIFIYFLLNEVEHLFMC